MKTVLNDSVSDNKKIVDLLCESVEQGDKKALKKLLELAWLGNSYAQYKLGNIYKRKGVLQNYNEAVKWYRLSAEQENADAQYKLGIMFFCGWGVMRNSAEAMKWWKKSAELGNTDAQCRLVEMFEQEECVKRDFAEAAKWYQKLAEKGKVDAQFKLGNMYECGNGVKQDFSAAAKWYQEAADQGNAGAQFKLGNMYESGNGVKQDFSAAAKCYQDAATQGNADAQCKLGNMYEHGSGVKQDFDEAIRWYQKSAEQGNGEALNRFHDFADNGIVSVQYILGGMYEQGKGVQKNCEEALKWYYEASVQGDIYAINKVRKFAEQGDNDSQCKLGNMYEHGDGVKQDYAEAVRWYSKAAEQGNVEIFNKLCEFANNGIVHAQRELACMYEQGKGVQKNCEEALKWYYEASVQGDIYAINKVRKFAEQGDNDSQCKLGNMYEHGDGVDKDIEMALRLYVEAAGQDNSDAKRKLKELAKQGNVYVQYSLGVMYETGTGFSRNIEKALTWYGKAAEHCSKDALIKIQEFAEQGNASAQYNLGVIYECGKGIPQNCKIAIKWYKDSV